MVPLIENPLEPGTVIDRYRIVSRLAVGGMAELYLADAKGIEGFEKRLVLKRIHPAHLGKPDFVGMFLDEARLAATLQHPNIAQVYDIGCDGDIYFFTMEYVDGRDVRHIYNRVHRRGETVPLDHTLNICIGALAGLHAAHEKCGPDGIPLGIVHRDVSPSNVIVTWDGNIKLIDFGIAKAARRQTMTRNGAVKGKHCSMSPEQACGKRLDRRSDIFSLGIMLWEMSVGETLFVAENEYEVMRRIVDGAVDTPSSRKPGYPAQLEAIVMKALAHRPEDRYQTAEEMLIALDDFARTERLVVAPYALARYLGQLFDVRESRDSTAPQSAPLFLLDGGSEIQLPRGGESLDATLDADIPDLDTASEVTVARIEQEEPGTDEVTVARLGSDEPAPAAEPEPVEKDLQSTDPALDLDHLTLPSRRPRESRHPAPSIPPPPRADARRKGLAIAAAAAVVMAAGVLAAVLTSSPDSGPTESAEPAGAPVEAPAETARDVAPTPEPTAPAEPAATEPATTAAAATPVDRPTAVATSPEADDADNDDGDEGVLSVHENDEAERRREARRAKRREERRRARAEREAAAAREADDRTAAADKPASGGDTTAETKTKTKTKTAAKTKSAGDKPADNGATKSEPVSKPAETKPDEPAETKPAAKTPPAQPTPDWAK